MDLCLKDKVAIVTNLIRFLSSDKAEWLTGQVIKVSGGHCL